MNNDLKHPIELEIYLKSGRRLRLPCPENMTHEDRERLRKIIESELNSERSVSKKTPTSEHENNNDF